jgi:L-alanine-DL-glutamate epimerase-like enolase superfamily enzyme
MAAVGSSAPAFAPKVQVLGVEAFEQPFRLRMPFRFGVVTLTEGRQATVRVHLKLDDGREGFGYAAEMLAAKWFDKSPALSDDDNRHQLRKAIEIAADAYRVAPPSTPFDLYADNYRYQLRAGRGLELPPLVASFGNALLDRAVLDAVCRLFGVSFWTAMRSNLAGMTPHPVIGDLGALDFNAFLAGLSPATSIEARHTVGLVDPITAADQAPGTRVGDGLPETLEEVVAAYGQRCFKLKVGGDRTDDLERLVKIASVLDDVAGLHVTLDGNEQYDDVESVVELWSAMEADPALQKVCAATLFIEQPIKRQVALSRSVAPLARLRPVIIDESDGELDAFPRARSLGYGGVSSKDCKGFYKSIVNLARCRLWNAESGDGGFFMSGEDLTTQAGLAVQQDLALVALLGLADVERNGHHFTDGFAGRPMGESLSFLEAHPDLYHEEDRRVRLLIRNGRLALGSLYCPGFGSAVVPDLSTTPRMAKAEWPPQR